eukprot:771383-Pleurochrysis_carterae.AAC.6
MTALLLAITRERRVISDPVRAHEERAWRELVIAGLGQASDCLQNVGLSASHVPCQMTKQLREAIAAKAKLQSGLQARLRRAQVLSDVHCCSLPYTFFAKVCIPGCP